MKNMKIIEVIKPALETINHINNLIKTKNLTDPLYKRALIRCMGDLGECLTYFRHDNNSSNTRLKFNPLLKEIQNQEQQLVTEPTQIRNYLLHTYPFEAYEGQEKFFNLIVKYLKNYNHAFFSFLKIIQSKTEVKNGALCCKQINSPPEDKSKYSVLNYAEFANLEITELLTFIQSKNIDVNNITGSEKKYIELALENYIENICSMLKAFNQRYEKSINAGDKPMNALFSNLTKNLRDFLIKINKFRQATAHDLTRNFFPKKILLFIQKIHSIQINYIQPFIKLLSNRWEKKFIEKCNNKTIQDEFEALKSWSYMNKVTFEIYKERLNTTRLAVMNNYANIFMDKDYLSSFSSNHYIDFNQIEPSIINYVAYYFFEPSSLAYLLPFEGLDYFELKKQKIDTIHSNIKKLKAGVEKLHFKMIDPILKNIYLLQENLLIFKKSDVANRLKVTQEQTTTYLSLLSENNIDDIKQVINENNVHLILNTKACHTLLHEAVLINRKDVVKYLLAVGADPFTQDSQGQKPADYLTERNDPKIKIILHRASLNTFVKFPFSEDEWLYFKNQIYNIKEAFYTKLQDFLKFKQQKIDDFRSKLHQLKATLKFSVENLQAASKAGQLFQNQLMFYHNSPRVRSKATEEQVKAWCSLLSQDSIEEIKHVINESNVNVMLPFPTTYTLLHHAVTENRQDVIQYLLSIGANPFAEDSNGENALDYVTEANDPNIRTLLSKCMCSFNNQPFSENEWLEFKSQLDEIEKAIQKKLSQENIQGSSMSYEEVGHKRKQTEVLEKTVSRPFLKRQKVGESEDNNSNMTEEKERLENVEVTEKEVATLPKGPSAS